MESFPETDERPVAALSRGLSESDLNRPSVSKRGVFTGYGRRPVVQGARGSSQWARSPRCVGCLAVGHFGERLGHLAQLLGHLTPLCPA